MASLGKIQEGEEQELTVPKAVLNDKREGKMRLLDLCVQFKCYFLLHECYDFYNANFMLLLYLLHNSNAYKQEQRPKVQRERQRKWLNWVGVKVNRGIGKG